MQTGLQYVDELVTKFFELGLRDAFAVTGGAIAPFTSAIVRHGGINLHYFLNEQSAGIAAESYSFVENYPSICIVTSGPGVTNVLTATAAAWTNSSPVIFISGQARSSDVIKLKSSQNRQIGNQHLPTQDIVSSIVKCCIEATVTFDPAEVVKHLFYVASSGRSGPVWLSLPLDIQRSNTSVKIPLDRVHDKCDSIHKSLLSEFQDSLHQNFLSAARPVILVGNGARNKIVDILIFAEIYHIPVLTTWPGMDLLTDSNPLYCGRPGSSPSSWSANLILTNTDSVLVLGARLDSAQIGYNAEEFLKQAHVIRVDVDQEEFDRIPLRENWENFVFDLRDTKLDLFDDRKVSNPNSLDNWWGKIKVWQNELSHAGSVHQELDNSLSTYNFLETLNQISNINLITTGSSGTCMEMFLQSWKVKTDQRIVNSCGLGSMGFGMAAAIGVSLRFPAQKILCIESDGSAAMNLQDLVTVAFRSLPIKLIILNSNGYKSISLSQSRLGDPIHGSSRETGLGLPRFIELAESLGIRSLNISNEIDYHKIPQLLEDDLPALINVDVSNSEEILPRLVSKPNEFGIMVTPPLDDLFPKLD
jgi:acetolactate synthase-1/2/3 large subunit